MESLLKCRKFEVVRQTVTGREGRTGTMEFVRHPGAVVVLPIVSDAHCLLLSQYRPALDRELWELPAGTLDVPGESPETAAARELEEETGFRAARWQPLCRFYPSPGILTEIIHAFVARDLTLTAQRLEPMERIRVERVPIAVALAMATDGRIEDAKTIITLLRWAVVEGVWR